jgi:hypothetical protein
MSVTIEKIDEAINETNRFIIKARKARRRLQVHKYAIYGCKETASLRRASMDLSRVLVDLRK